MRVSSIFFSVTSATACFSEISLASTLEAERISTAVSSSRMLPWEEDRTSKILSSISFSCLKKKKETLNYQSIVFFTQGSRDFIELVEWIWPWSNICLCTFCSLLPVEWEPVSLLPGQASPGLLQCPVAGLECPLEWSWSLAGSPTSHRISTSHTLWRHNRRRIGDVRVYVSEEGARPFSQPLKWSVDRLGFRAALLAKPPTQSIPVTASALAKYR